MHMPMKPSNKPSLLWEMVAAPFHLTVQSLVMGLMSETLNFVWGG
jgi:hypothetical protein